MVFGFCRPPEIPFLLVMRPEKPFWSKSSG